MEKRKTPTTEAAGTKEKDGGTSFLPGLEEKVNPEEVLELNSLIAFYNADPDDIPVMFDDSRGRWWRVHHTTVYRPEIPQGIVMAVAGDAVSMEALAAGGHVWVKEGFR